MTNNNNLPRIGFIGLGIMGRPMAKNLIAAGYALTVYNRSRPGVLELAAAGAMDGASPADVARRSDIIITIVTDTPDVVEVVLGEGGILEGAREGQILIDMSTISPTTTREIAAKCRAKGVAMIDAPVSGGELGAIRGSLAIMAGGPEHAFKQCLPIFDVLGSKAVLVGDHGAGQFTKAANQVILAGTYTAIAEALVLVSKAGLDPAKVVEAIKGGAAASWALEHRAPMMIERNFKPGFYAKLHWKDLKIVSNAAREMNLPLPLAALVTELYTAAIAGGHGDEDHCAIVKVIEKLAGIEL